jgi:hypothetical protein
MLLGSNMPPSWVGTTVDFNYMRITESLAMVVAITQQKQGAYLEKEACALLHTIQCR